MLLRRVIEEQGEEAGMTHLVTDYNGRYQHDLKFSLI